MAPLYVDMRKITTITQNSEEEGGGEKINEEIEDINKVFIGKVPIMLRSEYCSLHDHTDKELTELGVSIRRRWIFHHQRFRKGVDRARTNGGKLCVRVYEASTE